MTSRHMTYELDGIFQTRNQGQLLAAEPQQRKMVRTPGLMPMQKTKLGYRPTGHPRQSKLSGDYLDDAQDWFAPGTSGMGDIELPLIGTVSTGVMVATVAGLGLAGYLIYLGMKKRKAKA